MQKTQRHKNHIQENIKNTSFSRNILRQSHEMENTNEIRSIDTNAFAGGAKLSSHRMTEPKISS